MATISNVKNVDMQQLEFQNMGSSAVQTVLTQPLLRNASTYTSELVSFEINLDAVPIVPAGEEFLSVGIRPVGGMLIDLEGFRKAYKGGNMATPWYGDLVPARFGLSDWMYGQPLASQVPEWQNLPA